MNAGCISPDQMVRFLAGDLSPAREAEIAEHLRRCADCQDLAENVPDRVIDGAPTVRPRARAVASAAVGSLAELQGRLQALPLYDDATDEDSDVTSSTVTGGITQF